MKQFPRLGQRNSAATDMPVLPSLTLLLAIMTTCLAPTVDGGEVRPALETSVDASEQTADDLAEDGDNGDDDAKAEKESQAPGTFIASEQIRVDNALPLPVDI